MFRRVVQRISGQVTGMPLPQDKASCRLGATNQWAKCLTNMGPMVESKVYAHFTRIVLRVYGLKIEKSWKDFNQMTAQALPFSSGNGQDSLAGASTFRGGGEKTMKLAIHAAGRQLEWTRMNWRRNLLFPLVVCVGMSSPSLVLLAGANCLQIESAPQAAASSQARALGKVKAVSGDKITLGADSGAEVNVLVQDSTRIVRVSPGQKDLKDAAPISLQDVHAGDRILVRGNASDAGIQATSIVLMKQLDIAAKQQREREDWQKRGVGGLVKVVDPAAGTVTISSGAPGTKRNLVIKISSTTIVRRYAPDSVKFDDAKPGKLEEIGPGDQLRARGTLTASGDELAADEVVSGSFRNIAGTISSVNPGDNSIRVADLATKQPIVVKMSADSQLRKLPPMIAQRIAQRLKAPADSANAGGQASSGPPISPQGGGAPDLQQILQRVPSATLKELQKGDAVMIVATKGNEPGQVTAISLLSGVEPILSASPNESQASTLLSPWNLGANSGEAGAQ